MRATSVAIFLAVPALIGMGPACDSGTDGGPEDTSDAQFMPDVSEDAPPVGPDTADTPETTNDADTVGGDTAAPDVEPDTRPGGPDVEPDTAQDTEPGGPDAEPDTALDTGSDTQPPSPDVTACPPDGPTGTAIGDTLADTTLTTCEGVPVSLYSFCGRPLYINTFAGWCPPCRTDASNAAATAMTFPGEAQWLFVITENNSGTAPTTAYCEAIREAYGLTMAVLIDTAGTFPAHIGVSSPNSWHLVLDAGFGIVHRAKYDQRGALEALNTLVP